MTSRAATATIKGYYYQFDTSILELLKLTDDHHSITVEGIEDIDINTAAENTAVQCKYLSKSHYTNSAVREPITLMLEYYLANTDLSLKYTLYAHFENEIGGSIKIIDVDTLKSILTYKEKKVERCYYIENNVSNEQLAGFLKVFTLQFGKQFEVQQKEVLEKLKSEFKCNEFEADTLYYNNALRIVIDLAIKKELVERVITKQSFCKQLDVSKQLFNAWYIKLRSKKEYLLNQNHVIKKSGILTPSKTKYIFISREILENESPERPLVSFLEDFTGKLFKVGSLRTATPPTFIVDLTLEAMLNEKASLIKQGIKFNDGHEHISFSSELFNEHPIININKTSTKILKSSYFIKLLTLSTFTTNLTQISTPKVVLNFSKEPCPLPQSKEYQWIDIKYAETLTDIYTILA